MRKVRDSEHEESEHEESESEQRERRVWKRSGREGRVRERTGEHHQLRHQSPPPRPTRKGPHARAHTQGPTRNALERAFRAAGGC